MASFSPRLGSLTLVPADRQTVRFLALPDAATPEGQLQVWTDLDGEWRAHDLRRQSTSGDLLVVDIPLGKSFSTHEFQYTYRLLRENGELQWLSQAGGMDNGRIVRTSASLDGDDHPLEQGNPEGIIEPSMNVSCRVVRFTLSEGQDGAIESFDLGKPRYNELVGLTIEKTKPFWVTPRIFSHISQLSAELDTLMLLLSDSESVTAILPVSTPAAAATIRGSLDDSGHIWLRSERDSKAIGEAICIVNSGPRSDLLRIIENCTRAAKEIVKSYSLSAYSAPSTTASNFSLYGNTKAIYCTWNSLGADYTISAVLERLQALKDAGALEAYNAVLLDDGWQDVSHGRILSSFGVKDGWLDIDAETSFSEELSNRDFRRKDSGVQVSRDPSEETSPNSSTSLKTAIDLIKTRFPEIQSVGCWLTAQGYWNGLEKSGPLSEKYKLATYHRPKLEQYRWSHDAAEINLPCTEDLPRFWHDYFSALKSAGVDFVKVDNQADIDAYQGEGAGSMRVALLPDMRKAALEAFGEGNLVNCMPAGAREFTGYLSDKVDTKASMRTSDDFFPNLDDEHRFHVANNATTGYLDRYLSVIRDFDMFMTNHKTAEFHGQLRAFSNAPMYITDADKPDASILAKLGEYTPSGDYRLIQGTNGGVVKLPGTAFEDVTSEGPGPALKVGLAAESIGGTIIGVWNCRPDAQKTLDTLTMQDVRDALGLGVSKSGRYVISEKGAADFNIVHFTEASSGSGDTQLLFPLCLESGTCTNYTISPVLDSAIGQIAILGLQDKFAGLCAVSNVILEDAMPAKVQMKQAEKPTQVSAKPVEQSTERSPLLSRSQDSSSPPTSGPHNRLWTLLLFWRRDLRALRASLLSDFLKAPLSTLLRELRAVFGGPSTVTALAQAVSRTPSIRSPESSVAPVEASVSVGSSKEEPEQGAAMSVEVMTTGKLVIVLLDGKAGAYSFKLGGDPIAQAAIEWDGQRVTVDLDKALQSQKYSNENAKAFRITISRK